MEVMKAEQGNKEEKTETTNPTDPAKQEKKAKESEVPPPPQEIVLRVFMHCEGCAKKVRKCLKGFPGVEDVLTDCKTHKVVVKGEKADPVKVLEKVQKKSHSQVELLSPIPKPPPPPGAEDGKKEEKEVAKPEEKKEEPQVITVTLKAHMHCEACAQEIRKRILKMKGVENAEADLKNSQVMVTGVFDPQNLVDHVRKRTGKHGVIVKQEPEKKEEDKGKEENKAVGGGKVEAAKGGIEAAAAEGEGGKAVDMKKNEFYYNYPQNYQIYPDPPRFEMQSYAPEIFSDENPNACSVM